MKSEDVEIGQRVKFQDATRTEWLVGTVTEIDRLNVCWLDVESGPATRVVRCVEEVYPIEEGDKEKRG